MRNTCDIFVGNRFGWLRVIARSHPSDSGKARFLCQCRCGAEKVIRADGLRSGDYVSCGCRKSKKLLKHGMSRTPEHRAWSNMIERCYTKTHTNFPNWGGRGIRVCARWRKSFKYFLADMGYRPRNHSLHRKDNDGNYTPSNCKWATAKEQASNRRPSRKK